MGLTRGQRFGILAAGSAGVAAVVSKDILLSMFLASATPADDSQSTTEPTPELKEAIEAAVADTFGRRMATEEDYEIAAMGKLQMPKSHCTAQIAEIPGYFTVEEGTLLTTAAHCVFRGGHEDMEFITTYVNEDGEEVEFKIANDENNPVQVWVNPGYDRGPNDEKVSAEVRAEDTAIIFYPGVTVPTEIIPIKQRILAYHMAEYNRSVLSTFGASAAGFSADIPEGKSVDDECTTTQELNGGVVSTTCKINKGGSGSALLFRNMFDEIEGLAILSGVTVKDGEVNIGEDSFKSFYAPFYHYQLEGVDFLYKPEQCVSVNAEIGANLREHADIGSDIVFGGGLPDGDILKVRDTLVWERAEIGDPNVWLEVMETEDGRSGYIRSDLTMAVACP